MQHPQGDAYNDWSAKTARFLTKCPLMAPSLEVLHVRCERLAVIVRASPRRNYAHAAAPIKVEEQHDRSYRLKMSMKLIVPLNRARATSWDRLTAS